MSKSFKFFCTSLCVFSFHSLFADGFAKEDVFNDSPPAVQNSEIPSIPLSTQQESFEPFTGKVRGRKVRLRLNPSLESDVVAEMQAGELLSIIGEKEDFWAVSPQKDFKVYVSRKYVLDNFIEGNRVNIRLEPNVDAPSAGFFDHGYAVTNPSISSKDQKWFEIDCPPQVQFYIAKQYIEYVGGPEVKEQFDLRVATAKQKLVSTNLLAKSDLHKNVDEIDFAKRVDAYNELIHEYKDIVTVSEQAKDALVDFQEKYLHKRIQHLEALQTQDTFSDTEDGRADADNAVCINQTDKMKMWEHVEEALFLTWTNMNYNKNMQDYYQEQKITANVISGIVEAYNSAVKNKPGDFILRDKDIPVAYVYSTIVNLQDLVGKRVSLVATPRPNNNFAFPSYFVLDVK
ncbi:MAG: SH3 domain-containing protein [Chlamydiales bacterium]|jgi:hypothetical protein|nr:SH3 domain-containing protein [Chlamydiales bacterium]